MSYKAGFCFVRKVTAIPITRSVDRGSKRQKRSAVTTHVYINRRGSAVILNSVVDITEAVTFLPLCDKLPVSVLTFFHLQITSVRDRKFCFAQSVKECG